ncbi:unnamed protein product [Lactuca saligna]|uniref:Uncharacterized protein n=1 Tax=Lactuca saligna TaxID=75948 RepID=A0AA35V8L4_LACSI|nr:unnamed protein product [Lactuca saligna]
MLQTYVAVIEHSYGIILFEKKNIEKALKNGIEKFPDSLMLKEWYEIKNELFKKEKKADNGGVNSNEAGFEGDNNEGDAYGGNEEGFSLVRGLVVYGDMHDYGGGFSTPNVEKAPEILDASLSVDRTQRMFDSMLELHLKSLPKQEKLKDIGLVFFPVVDKSKYYLICFDLRVPIYYIIDHVIKIDSVEDIYGGKPVHVV